MKTLQKPNGEIDSTRVAVLIGVTIGLGIVVHEGFFLVAGAIGVGALAAAGFHAIHQHAQHAHLAQQQR